MIRFPYRLTAVVAGAFLVGAVAVPFATADAASRPAVAQPATSSIVCIDLNPVWGDGLCLP